MSNINTSKIGLSFALAGALSVVGCSSSSEAVKDDAPATEEAPEVAAAPEAAAAVPDAPTASPEVYKVVDENDQVRVIRMTLAAGANDNPHHHPGEAFYVLTGGKAAITMGDGTTQEADLPAGAAMINAMPTANHTVKNAGTEDINIVIFEIKDGATAAAPPEGAAPDCVAASPESYSVAGTSDKGVLIDMKLAKGAKDKPHSHHREAVYVVSGGKLRINVKGKEPMEAELPPGAVLLFDATAEHWVENIGDADFHAVIWELRG